MIENKILDELRFYISYHFIPQVILPAPKIEECHQHETFYREEPRHRGFLPEFEEKVEELSNECAENENEHEDIFSFILKKRSKETFSTVLMQYIDASGHTDVEIYKRADIDRRLFSKIRSDKHYRPKKSTALALALALMLSREETDRLLATAGYSLSYSSTSDIIIMFCLEKKIFDLLDVNSALDEFGEKTLCGI